MSEANGEKVRLWNDRAALGRHIWQGVVGICFLAGTATAMYLLIDFRVIAADKKAEDAIERTKENKAAIQKLTENVNTLSAGQMLLNQSVLNDRQNNADFRERTDKALDAIIEKLDEAKRRDRIDAR